MKINYGMPNRLEGKRAMTIGNFDGVHMGHQCLLKLCMDIAREENLISSVITFEPHPHVYFKNSSHGRIQTFRDKVIEIKNSGIKELIILPFKKRLANYSAQKFINEILSESLGMQFIIVGKDFKFGKNKSGNIQLLIEFEKKLNYKTVISQNVNFLQHRISSSRLRKFAKEGNLNKIKESRERPLTLSGHVQHGKKLGRKLGFPTLNLVMPEDLCLSGIFAVTVQGLDQKQPKKELPAIASLGRRPTVENWGKLILEVYVLDWSKTVYGNLVSVQLHKKIRDEIKFNNTVQMRNQMHLDEINTRKFFELDE